MDVPTSLLLVFAVSCNGMPAQDQRIPTNFHYDLAHAVIPQLIQEADSLPPLPVIPSVPMMFLSSGGLGKLDNTISLMQRLKAAESDPNPTTRGVIQNLFTTLANAFQEIVNRQQSLLDLIYCRNCNNAPSPWQSFLNAMGNIPALGWVMHPTTQVNGKPVGSFIAATNQDGVITGVAGSIIDNQPIVEYTFYNNHVTHLKPHKKPSVATLMPETVKIETEPEEIMPQPESEEVEKVKRSIGKFE